MNTRTSLHPSDGQLLGYLDRELSSTEAAKLDEHVAACFGCRETLGVFRTASAEIAALLQCFEAPVEPHESAAWVPALPSPVLPRQAASQARLAHISWYRRPSLRAALLVIGFGAVTLAVAPVRGWVVDLVRTVTSPVAPPATSPPPPQRDPPSSVVLFSPDGEKLTVDVAHTQAKGMLEVMVADGPRVIGRVTGSRAASLLVSGNGLRIRNEDASTASYAVAIPTGVRHLVVRVSGRVVLTVSREALVKSGTVRVPFDEVPRPGGTNPSR